MPSPSPAVPSPSVADSPLIAPGAVAAPPAPAGLAPQALDEASYRQVFLAAGVGLGRVAPSGRIIEANPRFCDIVGRAHTDLAGLHLHDLVHPTDLPACQAHFDAALGGQQERFHLESRCLRPDGSTAWMAANVVLVRTPQGQPLQFLLVIEDITERLRMQEAVSSARAAERASKAKTEFLSRMSHELRTPLNAMLGFAQLLRVDPRHPLHEDQRSKVAHIERAGAHLLAMLTDVLDLSRIEAGSLPMAPQALRVADTLEAAASLVSNQAADAGLRLLTTPPEAGLHVLADPVRLRQVLVNLMSNAVKYNRPGGHVMLEALGVGDEVALTVSDSGRGMNSEQLCHLFEPFNRLGAERTHIEGTGIGLVIVKRLVELMHGRIAVSSHPGEGTQFRVWLPRAPAPALPESDLPARQRTAFGGLDDPVEGTLSVLYAEDNVVNVELLRQVMRMRPQWHLEVALNGQDAIDMARSQPPDLLLLDMHLGDMSGLDVADALAVHPSTAAIPRAALSADVMPDQIAEARRRGFVEYLTKPLDVARLLSLLDRCARGEVG